MANKKELKELYRSWLHIEPEAAKAFYPIFEILGRDFIEKNRKRIFNKYIDKYFSTWDRFSDCVNGDYGFSPVVFCLFAETYNIKPNYPIHIMRNVLFIYSTMNNNPAITKQP